jgi:hypothetical protein
VLAAVVDAGMGILGSIWSSVFIVGAGEAVGCKEPATQKLEIKNKQTATEIIDVYFIFKPPKIGYFLQKL